MSQFKTRREFLEFFGRSASALALGPVVPSLLSCTTALKPAAGGVSVKGLPFPPLASSREDDLRLANGFSARILASYDDPLGTHGDRFGANNDYLASFRLNADGSDVLLWVNHESMHPLFVSGFSPGTVRTREQVEKEQKAVGGGFIRLRRESGTWAMVENDPLNRRVDATTEIPLIAPRPIAGSRSAIGTFANCAGGVTPWGTVLTCEENYDNFYGEALFDYRGRRTIKKSRFGWEQFFPRPPEHYGWVVEIHPLTLKAKKLTALGRFCHESATVRPAKSGRCAVYSGDDANDQCLYKFVADQPGSLETGVLYVANLEAGRWIPIDIRQQPLLASRFKDQTEVLTRCREAAFLVGGTALARPEDIEIDPSTGAVYVALTSNRPKGDHFGSILKIVEAENDPLSLEFQATTFVSGSAENGFACPDNMAFDRKGNLWLTTDMAGGDVGKPPYEPFGNNSLFYVPLAGINAGRAFRVASAPNAAEFAGPCFSHDGSTLFLSVQHPGETSRSLDKLTSHWPDGGTSVPRSAVVAITGSALESLTSGAAVAPLFELAPLLKADVAL